MLIVLYLKNIAQININALKRLYIEMAQLIAYIFNDTKSVNEEIIMSFKNDGSFIIYDCANKENYGDCQNNS